MLNPRPRILAVDDDHAVLSLVARLGAEEGFDVGTTASGDDAVRRLREQRADLVLLDVRMPGTRGLDILSAIRNASPLSRVALMTGFGTIEDAVQAVKRGASDYLTKPLDVSRVTSILRDVREQVERGVSPSEESLDHSHFHGMVGHSRAMREVFDLLGRLAPHARIALITGDTGSGKELAARALHAIGPRHRRRLVTVNCSAFVETLVESELFGHARGAFTGATDHKAGLFEVADGGTLFLDEVGELPLGAQAKLLRVLEDGQVQRVGSLEPRHVDVRVIAATDRDLQADVAAGRFRGDLCYYRLNVVQVRLPSLHDRREDIPMIARAFVAAFAQSMGRPLAGLTPGAESMLAHGTWEGNVRQLRNVVERACILSLGERVSEADLVGSVERAGGESPADRRQATIVQMPVRPAARLDEVAREHILQTLTHVHGNKAVAARLLGVSRRAFYRQLERHGLHHRIPAASGHAAQLRGQTVLGRAS